MPRYALPPGPGRPPKPPGERRKMFSLRLSPRAMRELESYADADHAGNKTDAIEYLILNRPPKGEED